MSYSSTKPANGTSLVSADIRENFRALKEDKIISKMGRVAQVVNYSSGALAVATALIPFDDTIPQITEGTEWGTLAITPILASSNLMIEVVLQVGRTNYLAGYQTAALFVDSTANAICVAASYEDNYAASIAGMQTIAMRLYVAASSTTTRTYKVRFGASANYMNINGVGAGRIFGGMCVSSITITELYTV